MQRSTTSKCAVLVLAVVSLLVSTLLIKAIINQVPTGTWASADSMAAPRSGAAAVLLHDGRLLITGGDSGSRALASADVFDTAGNFSVAAPMNFARTKHTPVV